MVISVQKMSPIGNVFATGKPHGMQAIKNPQA